PKPVTPNSRRVFVEVPLPPETFTPNGYAAFAMQLANSSGRSAGLSRQVLVPLEPLEAPSSFHATVGPNGIALNATVSGTRPPEVRIFRREKGQPKEVQITGHVSAEFGRNGVVMLLDEQFE